MSVAAGTKPYPDLTSRELPYNKDMVDWHEYLTRDLQVCGGELCAKRTRIPVTVILDSLGEASTVEAILASYPSLKPEHIQASLAYAAELAHEERLLPLKESWSSKSTRTCQAS